MDQITNSKIPLAIGGHAWLDPVPPRAVLGILAVILLGTVLYTRYRNDPLSRFPGPLLAPYTNALHSYYFLSGRQPYHLLRLHEHYGPVVRTAPNELSFASAASWRDIYGFRPGSQQTSFVKAPFYDGGSFADRAHSIVSERDPTAHGEMRRYLSHAFSERSLREQEGLVSEVVDLFIERIGAASLEGEEGRGGVDMVKWFNLMTFDIIGSLAFGESFGGLVSGRFHFWIKLVTNALRQGALADTFARFPFFADVFKALMPKAIEKLTEDTRTHEAHTMDLIKRRLKTPSDRPDFLTRILQDRDARGITDVQLAAHASDFVTAGSETTATALSCTVFYLLKTPRVMEKLRKEIDSSFGSYNDIDATAAQKLEYLHAVSLESMRMYAPLPFPLPRVVPNGGETVDGYHLPAGTIVSTNPVAASLLSKNFDHPFEYRPERWIGLNEKDVLGASQPFSLGPRGCLGRNLAWIELSTALAKLLFSYDMELLNKELDWHRDSRMATLWQKPELRVKLTTREKK